MSVKKSFKKLLAPVINSLVSRRAGWKVMSILVRAATWLTYQRSIFERSATQKKLNAWFGDLTVQNGPFKGLKYPGLVASGSSLYPKLLGSYESELHPLWEAQRAVDYSEIIDVGCAEGYYAVGLAIRYPHTEVYGYDTDTMAREACLKMAVLNRVDDRMVIGHGFDEGLLKDFPFTKRGLLIVDCEGCEVELFTPASIANLENCDVLVELHPMHVENIRERILRLLAPTHHIQIITSHDNARKIFDHRNWLPGFSQQEVHVCMEEGRQFSMDWVFATAK